MSNDAIGNTPPTIANGNVPPRRVPNATLRPREYLTQREIDELMIAARQNRHGHRDARMILIAYRHGLRASEVCELRRDQLDFARGVLHVQRAKRGTPSVHPMQGDEIRALRRLLREDQASRFVFNTERKGPVTTATFRKMVASVGVVAGMPFSIHPHMLRHACGYKLANDGHDTRALQHYLGHKNIQHTVRYTEMSADRFKGFWRE
jgi:integrase